MSTTVEVIQENGFTWVKETTDFSDEEHTSLEKTVTDRFLHPKDLDEVTGDKDPEECTHTPHNEIKSKAPDDRHEGSYCMYCGELLYAG